MYKGTGLRIALRYRIRFLNYIIHTSVQLRNH